MPIFYLDPVGGNDANAGNSFAARWRTPTAGPTAARISAGDEIRVIQSPVPVLAGVATWTDDSRDIVFPSSIARVIDNCDVAWVGDTNITSALTTLRKEGNQAVQLTPLTAFVTGKAAYRTLPSPLDLSGFQQVSFWFRHGALVAAGQVELRLCTDAIGDVAAHTIPIPAGVNGTWRTVVWDSGAPLSADIQSVSLWTTADPGTTAMRIDNIVACLPEPAPECVTHHYLVSKQTVDEPAWYPIMGIGENFVSIGGGAGVELGTVGASSLRPRSYRGATAAVNTYMRKCIDGWTTVDRAIQVSGTPAAPILFTGGWDSVDMSTQVGETYFTGAHFLGSVFGAAARTNLKFQKFGAAHFTNTTGCFLADTSTTGNIEVELEDICGCTSDAVQPSSSATGFWKTTITNVVSPQTAVLAKGSELAAVDVELSIGAVLNSAIGTSQFAISLSPGISYYIGAIQNSGGWGADTSLLSRPGTSADLYNCVFDYNTSGDISVPTGMLGELRIWGGASSDPVLAAGQLGSVAFTRKNGSLSDHAKFHRYFTLRSDLVERHTLSGISWCLRPINSTVLGALNPAKFDLARVGFPGGSPITVRCWMFKDSSTLTQGMRVRPGHPGTDPAPVVYNTGAANQWNEVTLTFTPTVAGVVIVEGVAFGGTTFAGFFDDFSIEGV